MQAFLIVSRGVWWRGFYLSPAVQNDVVMCAYSMDEGFIKVMNCIWLCNSPLPHCQVAESSLAAEPSYSSKYVYPIRAQE